MSDASRWVTDEAIDAACHATRHEVVTNYRATREALIAAAPHIRRAVLQEAAGDVQEALDKFVRPAEAAVERVRALHQPYDQPLKGRPPVCRGCRAEWPCPTFQALGDDDAS